MVARRRDGGEAKVTQTLDQHLRREALLPSTRHKYASIIASAGKKDLLGWIRRRVHSRTPIGTILPMRAAVKHYLVAVLGYDPEEVQRLLPKARGRESEQREGLTLRQLALYHAAVEQVDREPVRTILTLLPSTGMRIAEITGLHRDDVRSLDGRMYFVFRGKRDKQRTIPLTRGGEQVLQAYLAEREPQSWLFPGYVGSPITPAAVRKYTRRIASGYPDLRGLSPHILRHTYASMLLKRGADLKTLQALLGHKSIVTTQRYLHPDFEMLQDAADLLE